MPWPKPPFPVLSGHCQLDFPEDWWKGFGGRVTKARDIQKTIQAWHHFMVFINQALIVN